MADFQAHINQAKKNLSFLSNVSNSIKDSWDWQVTSCYYTAVHLMNAHLAKSADLHYKTHEKVKNALYDSMSPSKISDDIYTSYVKLENLSRRARYLCHDDPDQTTDAKHAFLTYDKHLLKAIKQLEKILSFFTDKYGESFPVSPINCVELKNVNLKNFYYQQVMFSQ